MPYLARSACCASWASVPGSSLAVPGESGPAGLPRTEHDAMVTAGLARSRCTFPVAAPVHTSSRPPSRANQTGVVTAAPLRRKVVSAR